MAGNKKSGRPGGNPDIAKVGYKIQDPDRAEPYDKRLGVWVTSSMMEKLKAMGTERSSFVREAIATALEKLDSSDADT